MITYTCKTKAKASLKLFNHISSYLFEQEYDELRGNERAKSLLNEAKKVLYDIIHKQQ